MADLKGKVAVVTGASRGVGRGVAEGLAEAGATVYITGRSESSSQPPAQRTIQASAVRVDELGGRGIAVRVDHNHDDEVRALFERVHSEQGRLDILVNNVYKIPDPPAWGGGFWDHPLQIWDDQVGIGLRSHYIASWYAAPLMFEAGAGAAFVNVSSPGGQSYIYSSSYGAGKAGLDRLTADMAIELQPKGIPAISLYPGSVSTEFIQDAAAAQGMDLSDSQTPLFVGRCTVALLATDDLMSRTGTIQWVEDLGEEFEILDENGKRPPGSKQRSGA
jgi:NAD(P)-dependent dehydrogenase (short-subunit alcohol dehydrogenase family)